VNLSAIDDKGKALWPEARPIDWLSEQREQLGEHVFQAMYQGRPRPLGGELFGPPTFCEAIPDYGTYSVGVDLAYSSKTHADYSVSLVLKACQDGKIYVVDVVRKQVKAPEFALALKSHASQYPGSPMTWHAAGSERGAADFLIAAGIPLKVQNANTDKFVRSQPVAAAWAAGKIMIPRSAPWAGVFLDEVCGFTGVNDAHDDMVDALASAFSALRTSQAPPIQTFGTRSTAGLRSAF
jgi:predicted phage terminase large subunit-like protein